MYILIFQTNVVVDGVGNALWQIDESVVSYE